ncbi:hypothetical protein BGAL_0203g00020 [Botrytis galanthina]|uniref:Uncharacterized protein n=1 Tax=Botrytis galanthina TaxID=278940 RepID=A0A4S8QVK2_9HELO|nr:hypothetical protein BGAL_0203g00020 [Botrytis galanthina]
MGLDVFAFWGEKFDDWECLCSDERLIASLTIKRRRGHERKEERGKRKEERGKRLRGKRKYIHEIPRSQAKYRVESSLPGVYRIQSMLVASNEKERKGKGKGKGKEKGKKVDLLVKKEYRNDV